MNLQKKRHIASWMLLAVFVPMLLLSSLHVHDAASADDDCTECVLHRCHGHILQSSTAMHDCVLCQLLTLPLVLAPVIGIAAFSHFKKEHTARNAGTIRPSLCGIPTLRAPPTV